MDGMLVLPARLGDPTVIERCRQRKIPAYAEVGWRTPAMALQLHH